MQRHSIRLACLLMLLTRGVLPAQAQTPPSAPPQLGTVVTISADSEVKRANDVGRVTLSVEEQDKDKVAAASRVNLKMKQGTEIVRHEDPQGVLTTRGYYTVPVYADEPAQKPVARLRQPIGWRVGQTLELVTTNLTALPKTVAAAQRVMALNGVSFSLSTAATRKLDDERIAATYHSLTERIAAVARAMGRPSADAVIESIDFDGAGGNAFDQRAPKMLMRAVSAESSAVEEPSFEPGETALTMQAHGKVRFK